MFTHVLDAWSAATFGFPALPSAARHGGEFIRGDFDTDDRTVHYKLFVPSSYRGKPMPLVVMLHACGQDADDFALGTGMNALAEERQVLVLYPEQSIGAHWNKCWNWYDPTHHQRGAGEPALIAALTRHIAASYAVDATRTAVAGLSSGAAMAVTLGWTYPDLFNAVGCHSGLPHGSATDGVGAMLAMRDGVDPGTLPHTEASAARPVIVFHGDADATVHRHNSADVVRQSVDKHAVSTIEEKGESGGRAFTRCIHADKDGVVLAEHWIVHGAGHAWSGGSQQGSYADSYGPDASKEMLRFFLKH